MRQVFYFVYRLFFRGLDAYLLASIKVFAAVLNPDTEILNELGATWSIETTENNLRF